MLGRGMTKETEVRIASLSGALAVGLGAFGAHGLEETLTRHGTTDTWETAVFYHFVHTLVLLWISGRRRLVGGPRWCFMAGIVIFSGTLYLLSLTGVKWLGAITPIGGTALIAGWVWLLVRAPDALDSGP